MNIRPVGTYCFCHQPVIKAHGSSKAKGIKNAIRQAKICVENDLCGTMQSALDELAAASKTEE